MSWSLIDGRLAGATIRAERGPVITSEHREHNKA